MVHPPVQPRSAQLRPLHLSVSVGDDALRRAAAQGFHGLLRPGHEAHRIAQSPLIGQVEFPGPPGIGAAGGQELLKAAGQDPRAGHLPPFEHLPVPEIEGGVALHHPG